MPDIVNLRLKDGYTPARGLIYPIHVRLNGTRLYRILEIPGTFSFYRDYNDRTQNQLIADLTNNGYEVLN